MEKNSSNDSIESIVAERLDSIFGDDEEEDSPPPAPAKPSPLRKMQQAMEALNTGVTPRTVDMVASEVRALGTALGEDALFRPLLKIAGMLIGNLKTGGETARQDATKTLASVVECMRALAEDDTLPITRKRVLVQREIEAFRAFRESLQEKPSVLQVKVPPGPAREKAPQPTPAPPLEKAPEKPAPEPKPAPPLEKAPEKPAPEPKPAPTLEKAPEKPAPEPKPAPTLEKAPEKPAPEPKPAPPLKKAPEEPAPESRTAPTPAVSMDDIVVLPEAEPRSPDTGLWQEALHELQTWIGKAVSDVKDQIQEVKAALPDRSETPTDDHEELNQLAAHIKDLSGVPQSLKMLQTQMLGALVSLKKSMDALQKRPTEQEPVRGAVREEMELLRKALEPVLQIPSAVQKLEKETHNALEQFDKKVSNLQKHFEDLRDAIRATRLDLNRLRSVAEGSEAPLSTEGTGQPELEPSVKEEGLPSGSLYGPWDLDEPGYKGSTDEGVAEDGFRLNGFPELELEDDFESEAEPAPYAGANEKAFPDPSSSLPSGQYFLFYTGGRKYAVDARYVVKSTRIGGAITKKARNTGTLTLADVKSVLSSPRKGIEPPWERISDEEIKQTAYSLVPDSAIDGLAATNGGGALFLRTNEKTLLILSDEPAVKATLNEEDEIQMTTASDTSQSATCGSIMRSGEGAEFYLILAPERLG
ncbi:MAG: hypothetical protein PVG49_00450 [Desulfobacteraceae bacterium]